jgi:hypothetical protein
MLSGKFTSPKTLNTSGHFTFPDSATGVNGVAGTGNGNGNGNGNGKSIGAGGANNGIVNVNATSSGPGGGDGNGIVSGYNKPPPVPPRR